MTERVVLCFDKELDDCCFLVYLLSPGKAMRDAMALRSVTFSFSNCSFFAGGNDLKA